ncbi:hypothetical protein KM043_004362 [Ampulex compressa]|nr:hypothetical protein KM043_004362 [Ampulex compressa]
MASGDNVDVIEVVETSFSGAQQEDHLRPDQSTEEDNKSTTEKVTAFDNSVTQHGTAGPKTPAGVSRNKSERERKIGHRRVGVGGEITYKKIQTTQIMGSIQLGIQHAVGGLASKPERDLLMQDFMTVETTNFPSEGSNHTPAHHFSEFKFKNYAPIAFRYFRDLFGIQPDDFLMSMCSAPLRELSNPGASGSIFYLTDDDEFIIKTVQHKEGEFLQTLLPGYYMNLNQNPRTLLPKFFGLYCYRCNSKNVRLVAMNNLLPSAVKLHQKYDLKGSTYKRKASKSERSKSSPTYKDLDFMEHHPEGIFLEADTYGALVKTIQRDCRVLESFKIMDYSLLVGIHNLDQAAREKAQDQRLSASADEEVADVGGENAGFVQAEREREREDRIGATALNRSRSINRQRLVAHSTAMESIQAESEPIDEEDDVPPGGIPARNARGERLLLFLGIIDILQSYRLKKKLEHTWKSMIHDGDTVSVHRPGFYAQRFQDFMAKTVFKKIPSLDLPEIKGNHRKFRNLVTSYIALKHSPSKRKSITRPLRPLDGDFDSTAVAATGSSTMHATSPTKAAVSPTEFAISTTSTAISSGSIPIATSTPVNQPAGPVSPPPLSLAPGGLHQEQPPVASPTAKLTTYPAVLKGRSAASPPNPNLVPSGKVPPPVPPRGTGHSRGAAVVSSATSSRGDEAALITRYRLHESSSLPHRHPHSNSTGAALGRLAVLHARSSTPAYLPPRYESLSILGRVEKRIEGIREEESPPRRMPSRREDQYQQEEEEFVSVEKVDDSYVIRTSSFPFRPERGNYVSSKRRLSEAGRARDRLDEVKIRETEDSRILGSSKEVDRMAKFTYFLNPASRPELMNYKMSRKDKKHSETYYERMRRKQRELEASITTSLNYRRGSEDGRRVGGQARGMLRRGTDSSESEKPRASSVKGDAPAQKERILRKASKKVESVRDGRLLRRIKGKSARRNKKLAPTPSSRKEAFRSTASLGRELNDDEETSVERKGEVASQRDDYLNEKYSHGQQDIRNEKNTIPLPDSTRPNENEKSKPRRQEEKSALITKSNEGKLVSAEDEGKKKSSSGESIEGRFRVIKVQEACWAERTIEQIDLIGKSLVTNKVEIFQANETRAYNLSRCKTSDERSQSFDDTISSNERHKGSSIDDESCKLSQPLVHRKDISAIKGKLEGRKNSTEPIENSGEARKEIKVSKLVPNATTLEYTFSECGTLPSTCSTPPPPFDDAVRSNDQTLASGGHLQQGAAPTILTSSLSSAHHKQNKVVHHVTLTKTYHDTVSISDVHLESSGSGSGSGGRETKSSLSVESGGSGRGGGGLNWTPPAGSAEGSTPTWTEGTPSFTESSSSGDAGCPTTPIRGSHRQDDGGRIAATVEEALASLTTEMRQTKHNAQRLEQSTSYSMYRQVRTSFKQANSKHVAIMRSMQRALNIQRQEP